MRLTIRVRPGASAIRVGGTYGEGELAVAVTARAVDGRATDAALRAVAGAFGVKPSAVRLVHGATSRTKVVEIDGDAGRLEAALAALLRG